MRISASRCGGNRCLPPCAMIATGGRNKSVERISEPRRISRKGGKGGRECSWQNPDDIEKEPPPCLFDGRGNVTHTPLPWYNLRTVFRDTIAALPAALLDF